jgi:predicted nucleic acid-binding protein
VIPATHLRYVLDASVVAKWFTRHGEADREQALALRDLHRARRCLLVVPEFGLLEVLNAIRFSRRARETDTAEALAVLRDLELQVEPVGWDLLQQASGIAWTYRLTLYDAAYVALAEHLGLPLVTADESLSRQLQAHGTVLSLRDLRLP